MPDFYFSSWNWENLIQISLSPFKIWEIVFKSLFSRFDFFASYWPRVPVAHSRVVLISLLKYLKWANNFNAEREKALSNSHTLSHCYTAILSKLQGYSHNECSSCNNRHQKPIHVPRIAWLVLLSMCPPSPIFIYNLLNVIIYLMLTWLTQTSSIIMS